MVFLFNVSCLDTVRTIKRKKSRLIGCVAHHIAMKVVGDALRNWWHADDTFTICRDLDLTADLTTILTVSGLQRLSLSPNHRGVGLSPVGGYHTDHRCLVDVETVTVTETVTYLVVVSVLDYIDASLWPWRISRSVQTLGLAKSTHTLEIWKQWQ